MIFEGEAAVDVDSQVPSGGQGGVFGGDALYREGDVVGEGFGGRVEDPYASFVRGEGQLPEPEPGGNVVEDGLNVPEFGFVACGGSAGY